MSTFAKETTVPAERSRAEIEMVLRRYGADQFYSGWTADGAVLGFRAQGRNIKFELSMPQPTEARFATVMKRGRTVKRTPDQSKQVCEQQIRQRWRAMLLVIKAKLEAVEAGISTFEREFLANVMLPDGQTVGAALLPQLEAAYADGSMPKLLTAIGER